MKTINELLARWAELEPGTVSNPYKGEGPDSFYYMDGTALNTWSSYINTGVNEANLQWVVQRSIEANGMFWCRGRDMVQIVRNGEGVVLGGVIEFEYESFTHALLAAYIKALEAVAEVVE